MKREDFIQVNYKSGAKMFFPVSHITYISFDSSGRIDIIQYERLTGYSDYCSGDEISEYDTSRLKDIFQIK